MNEDRREMIYQANPLISGRKPFTSIEMRLFLLALQHVNPHLSKHDKFYDKHFEELFIPPAQVKKIFGHGEYLKRLEAICDGMTQKAVTVSYEEGGFKKYPVFGYIEYKPKEGLRIKFNEDMRPLLLDIFESGYGYTKVAAKQLFTLSSAYAVRLLELMLQYRGMMKNNVITRHFELDDLREKMDVKADEYQRINDFKKRVLNDPVREIEKSTMYKLSYTVTKTGRKITGFDIMMDCSEEVLSEAEVPPETTVKLEITPKKSDWHGLSEQAVNKLTTICGSNEEFLKRMDYAIKLVEKRKPSNLQGFLYKAIQDNYLQQEKDEQAAIEREIRAVQENNDWEQAAAKMFNGEIQVDEGRPEKPFDLSNPMERAQVNVIKNSLKKRNLSFTSRLRLEEHNMSVGRFIELYAD